LKEFAKHIGVSNNTLSGYQDVDSVIGHIQKHLTTQLERRKQNLIQIANEVDLGLCFDPKTKKIDQKKLEEFYNDNPKFCEDNLIKGQNNFKIKTKLPFFYNVLEWLGIYSLISDITKRMKQEVTNISKKIQNATQSVVPSLNHGKAKTAKANNSDLNL